MFTILTNQTAVAFLLAALATQLDGVGTHTRENAYCVKMLLCDVPRPITESSPRNYMRLIYSNKIKCIFPKIYFKP